MRLVVAVMLSLLTLVSNADSDWQWSQKIAIGNTLEHGVYHHLDGSGRKHIAVTGEHIAVVWEDDSSGSPQIYLATKIINQKQFNSPVKLSNGREAYEPSITAMGDSRFVIVYEEDESVYTRLLSKDGLGKAIKLSTDKPILASSPSITAQESTAYVIWREKHQTDYRLFVTILTLENNQPVVGKVHSVEDKAMQTPMLKPVIAIAASTVFVAWEDRREGHTRLLFSHADATNLQFSDQENLNEFFTDRNEYDKGSGVTRLSMAAFGEGEVLATWMDKRRGGVGYGIFASFGSADDESFGPNEKVHGKKGDLQPHYNPSVTGNTAGDFIVAWDDFRNGNLDIWLSRYNNDDEWGVDNSPAIASGPGEQSHASVLLDEDGGLHLVWISREETTSPTRLWYSYGVSE